MKRIDAKFFTLSAFGLVMTLFTVILGTPFIRLLQKAYSPFLFWAVGIFGAVAFLAAKALPWAVLVGSVWILVGLYGEFEKRGLGWKNAGILSLGISNLVLMGGIFYLLALYDINTWDRYVLFVGEIFTEALKFNPKIQIDAALLANKTPSFLVILLLLGLGNALILEKKMAQLFGVHTNKIASELKLTEFRLPDSFIWIFLLSFLFSMIHFDLKWLGILSDNIFNVGIVLFFFQGLAVLEVFFAVVKTSPFFRVLTYFIMVGYLFVLLSVLGLIDYWVDFRWRLRRKPAPVKN